MNPQLHPCLRTPAGARVPLTGVRACGRLNGLLFGLTVEQDYRNTSAAPIETVYTFPLPVNAVLLSFELDLNGARHTATAFSRQQAERKYEDAIDDGNSAALPTHNGNGLYTATVANLKAGEEATVRYRYAELLHANRNQVRVNLPTVIAPRYGNPADAGLEGPAIPGADLLIEYPFTLYLTVEGMTDPARLSSPSHQIACTATESSVTVATTQAGFLDRDFVLNLDLLETPSGMLVAADGDGYVALASTVLAASDADNRPLAVKILLDCSGSMAGTSIEAAKRALVQILGRLTDTDRFSLTRFGSSVQHVTEGLEPADAHSIRPVSQIVQGLDANMGGTNMPEAITATIAIPVPNNMTPDLILITDGQIHSVDRVVESAEHSAHRLFVVAIGAAPNEALARRVSERTGGACDFVAPGERVEPAILRMYGRLRAAPRTIGEIDWGSTPEWTAPLPTAVFPNDSIHLFARFRSRPRTHIDVEINGPNKEHTSVTLVATDRLVAGDVLPRLAAAQRMTALPEAEARAVALQYQLSSEFTSLVLVAERKEGDKITQLPQTISVPHMLAAGWGGSAQVDFAKLMCAANVPRSVGIQQEAPLLARIDIPGHRNAAPFAEAAPRSGTAEGIDIPDFLRRKTEPDFIEISEELRSRLVGAVARRVAEGHLLPATLDELFVLTPLPENLRTLLLAEWASSSGRDATQTEFVIALVGHLDRREHLITLPPSHFAAARRIRAVRTRLAMLLPLATGLS